MHAVIKSVEYHLPESVLTNAQLTELNAKWTAAEIEAKTGIVERHVSATGELASDLAVTAIRKTFDGGICRPHDVDFLLFCTQSPDYLLPTTACLVQERLGLPKHCAALDFNLGCSGFVYGLGLAKGLIETGQSRCLLLVTADTYTKYIHAEDLNVRTLFGDAAAATLIIADDGISDDLGPSIGPFVYGTDGRGARNLIVHNSGLRPAVCADEGEMSDSDRPCHFRLFMDGPEIFRFTIEAVPPMVIELLDRSNLALADVQLFVFHQANKFMLDHLRTKMKIPREKFYIAMRHCGNTVSASIPIALKHAWQEGRLQPGDRVVLVGFGVGYSWAAALVRWAI